MENSVRSPTSPFNSRKTHTKQAFWILPDLSTPVEKFLSGVDDRASASGTLGHHMGTVRPTPFPQTSVEPSPTPTLGCCSEGLGVNSAPFPIWTVPFSIAPSSNCILQAMISPSMLLLA